MLFFNAAVSRFGSSPGPVSVVQFAVSPQTDTALSKDDKAQGSAGKHTVTHLR